jgi:hypothetical protein
LFWGAVEIAAQDARLMIAFGLLHTIMECLHGTFGIG